MRDDKKTIPNILSIAGSDPSGGAGIQADLKTFSAFGCYGMAAITALTAQNTQGVTAIHQLPPAFVSAQLEAVFSDIRVDAVKIGMAGSPDVIHAIADLLERYRPPFIVLDPVMVAQSGDPLLSDKSVQALIDRLIPLATIVTPNIPEAEILLGAECKGDLNACARALFQKFSGPAILLKGGHGDDIESTDILAMTGQLLSLPASRIATKNNHGTGCTLSSALASLLAHGLQMPEAARAAKKYITGALMHSDALDVGGGAGPVHHFFDLWKNPDE